MGDRRSAERHPLSLAVELKEGTGRTRDVSVAGVFIMTDRPHDSGAPLHFALCFDRAEPGLALRLHCEGRVVRVERVEGQVGVAVVIQSHRLEAAP